MADQQAKAAGKEINAELKAAKEAIKQKEYKVALKHCKNVLKIDKSNYHALVFIGLCAKEMEQFDQSRAAYKKAIDQNSEQVLAWQGLCNLYEAASKEEWKHDLAEVYAKLMNVNKNDITKWKDLLAKIIPLQLSLGMTSEALHNLKDLEGTTPEPSLGLLSYWQKVLNLLHSKLLKDELTTDLQDQIENSFQSVLEYSRVLGIDTEESQQEHLVFLRASLKDIKEDAKSLFIVNRIIAKGRTILEEFPNNIFALELVVRIMLEQSSDVLSAEAVDYIKQINEQVPTNVVSIVGTAFVEARKQNWITALNSLRSIQGVINQDYIAAYWLIMARIHLYLHDPKSSLNFIEKGIRNIKCCITDTGRGVYSKAFSICKASCYIEMSDYEKARDLLIQLTQKDNENAEILYQLGISYANLKDNDNALEACNNLLQINPASDGALVIKALISINEEKHYDAELRLHEAIELHNDIGEYHFLLGKVYWKLKENDKEYGKKSQGAFLKAAKLDPYNSNIFFALGDFYRLFASDLKKAQKCYQKAVSLNKLNEDAALALGEISMDLGEEENAFEVYEQTTKNFGAGRVKIAWLRLGMLLTKRGSPDQAVTCFQSALRSDPSDWHTWECLGDAYIARGSYMAALKAFQKALEIEPSSLYCRYKIGIIKQSVCVFSEAIEEFKQVLVAKEDDIPALKGLAECHLSLEYASISENFDGRAVDHAFEVFEAAARAVEIRPDLHCFWKIIGDASFALHVIAEEKLRSAIPVQISKILGIKPVENEPQKRFMLDLSRRCFAVVVKLEENSAPAWHDLSLSSFHYGTLVEGEAGKVTMQQSIQFIKKAISLEPQNAKMWNTLGVVSGSSDIANPELSQHAFIKALQLEPQNAEIWTNLGALYLKYDKVQAAHEAFKKAQDADPAYAPAWVGQASIAEVIGTEDAMDLFRHSSELGSHTECYLAYSKWVCFSLKDFYSKGKLTTKQFDSFHVPDSVRKSIANSSVCANKYADRLPGNSGALNLLGVLLEHQKLFKQSEIAFRRAYQLLMASEEVEKKNMVLSNLARVLRQSAQYKESINVYLKIQPLLNPNDVTGLALAYFLDGQLEQSFQTYEQALNLTSDERDKSDILAAMGMIGYTTGNSEIAKSFLFKSSQTDSPSERGLLALAALGLLSKDHTLTNAALHEIKKHPDFGTEEVEENFVIVNSAMSLLQGDLAEAKKSIQRLIRRYPGSSKQWTRLARFISRRSPLLPLEIAGRCAQISSTHQPSNESSMIISAAAIGSKSFASKLAGQRNHYISCLRAAQRAVHSNPGKPENWALLSAAALSKSVCNSTESTRAMAISTSRLALLKAEETLAHLETALKTTISNQLEPRIRIAINLRVYTIKQLVWAYLHDGGYDISVLLTENAMTQYEEDEDIFNELQFLRIISEILFKYKQGGNVDGLMSTAKLLCDSDTNSNWKYQVLSRVCVKLGFPLLAEFSLRKCIQQASQNGLTATQYASFVQLVLLSVRSFSKDKDDKWVALATEALAEAAKFNSEGSAIDLLRMTLLHVQDDAKKVTKILARIQQNGDMLPDLLNPWLLLYAPENEEKQEIVDKDLYEVQNWT